MPDSDDDVNRETNEVTSRLDSIHSAILANAIPKPGVFDMNATAGGTQQTHVRMRIRNIVVSVDNVGAVIITLQFGNRRFLFAVVGPLTLVLPPPVEVIDRGTDIDAGVNVGNLLSAYFTYTPE